MGSINITYNVIGYLGPTIISILLLVYFLSLKRKTTSTWYLIAFYACAALFGTLVCYRFSLINRSMIPLAPAANLGSTGFTLAILIFAYHFPSNYHPRESKIVFFVFAACLVTGYLMYLLDFRSGRVFNFATQNYLTAETKHIKLFTLSMFAATLWTPIVLIRKTLFHKSRYPLFEVEGDRATKRPTKRFLDGVMRYAFPGDRDARSLRAFSMVSLLQASMSALYALYGMGRISWLTYQMAMTSGLIVVLFLYAVISINNAPQPTSFMVKIVGIPLVTVLLLLGVMSRMIHNYSETSYENLRQTEIQFFKSQIEAGHAPPAIPGLAYCVYRTKDNPSAVFTCGSSAVAGLTFDGRSLFKNEQSGPSVAADTHTTVYNRKYRAVSPDDPETFFNTYTFGAKDRIYELGYAYLAYRRSVNNIFEPLAVVMVGVTLFLLIIFPLFFRANIVMPLNALLKGVDKVNKGDYTVNIPIYIKDEIGYLTRAFNGMVASILKATRKLERYANDLEGMVEERTKELTAAMEELSRMNDALMETRDALWGEMQLAKKIQTVLLPPSPEIPGFELACHMEPADEVGGDYYDVIDAGETHWITIGDVSGHGVTAGLIMMMAQTTIRSMIQQKPDISPEELLTAANKILFGNIKRMNEKKYMTACLLEIHAEGRISYAGLHQDLLIYRAATSRLEPVETNGTWIGIMDDLEGLLLNNQVTLNQGDLLFLFTDGVTEAVDENDRMFSEERLCGIIEKEARKPLKDIKERLLGELAAYRKDDDVTFILARRLT